MTIVKSNGFATITMWTVFDHPSDAPDAFVAREYEILASGAKPTSKKIAHGELDAVRRELQAMNLERFDRDRNDDPKIVETWL